MRVLSVAVATALLGAVTLVGFSAAPSRDLAMMVLGGTLAPIFPLLLSRFFAGTYSASGSRWLLATCGFGGSVLPWITGWVSVRSHSLRMGLSTVPAALFIMLCVLPIVASGRQLTSPGVADQPDSPI
jgi:fucose permease